MHDEAPVIAVNSCALTDIQKGARIIGTEIASVRFTIFTEEVIEELIRNPEVST